MQRAKCMVRTNDSVVDLSGLSSTLSNYHFLSDAVSSSSPAAGRSPDASSNAEVLGPRKQPWDYFVAVCRSLVPVPGLDCDPGASACRAHSTASDYADVRSLGKFNVPPWVDANGDVHLTYTGGSKCGGGSGVGKTDLTYSTDILFKCGAGLGVSLEARVLS